MNDGDLGVVAIWRPDLGKAYENGLDSVIGHGGCLPDSASLFTSRSGLNTTPILRATPPVLLGQDPLAQPS